jgi:hypothetical protein
LVGQGWRFDQQCAGAGPRRQSVIGRHQDAIFGASAAQ